MGISRTFSLSTCIAGTLSLTILFLSACTPVNILPIRETPLPAETPASLVIPTANMTSASPTKAVPALTTLQPTCQAVNGILVTGAITTSLLDKPMRYTVYLPPCYDANAAKPYPVLYLLHGQNFTEDQWVRIGAPTTADAMQAAGEISPFIMVFPYDYSYKQPTEYKFEDVFIDQLIPTIDKTFHTDPRAKYRAIGGLSRGGAWALHIGADHPGMFGAIGGHSPSIFFVDERSLPRKLLAIPAYVKPRLWLDAGNRDSEYAVVFALEEFLSENNYPHVWHTFVGWHDEKYWSTHVAEYLRWYAQDWK